MTAQDLPPTAAQCLAIVRLCFALNIKERLEDKVKSRGEAGILIRDLSARVRANRRLYAMQRHGLGRW